MSCRDNTVRTGRGGGLQAGACQGGDPCDGERAVVAGKVERGGHDETSEMLLHVMEHAPTIVQTGFQWRSEQSVMSKLQFRKVQREGLASACLHLLENDVLLVALQYVSF